MLSSAFFHELGHLLVMKLFGITIDSVHILPLGIDIKASPMLISYKKQIIISLAGAAVNIILFLIFCLYSSCLFFSYFNLLYGLFNMLPIKGLDGGE
ncbi:MAG: hypothetical protein IKU52_00070, partial [Clostridia bacterium]|nr:hypothetical protein [Clostridia bacterium]